MRAAGFLSTLGWIPPGSTDCVCVSAVAGHQPFPLGLEDFQLKGGHLEKQFFLLKAEAKVA